MKILLVSLLSLVMFGCGQSNDIYLGKWVNIKNEKNTLNIKDNGDSLIIEKSSTFLDRTTKGNVTGKVKDGTLYINAELGEAAMVIDKTTGNLTGAGSEFKKVK
jgi:hypothetical protein